MTSPFDFKRFEPIQGKQIKAVVGDLECQLTCQSVESREAPEGFEAFSVVFRGDANHAFQQQSVKLSDQSIGDVDVFLVPFAKDDQGVQYEAIINRKLD